MKKIQKKELHVLLIEDEPIIQKVHSKMLRRLGYNVDITNNGLQALKLFSQNYYNAVLTDIGLPSMSGLEIIAKIRCSDSNKKHIPIVALTAYTQNDVKDNCISAGANYVLIKPVKLETLKNTMKSIVD